MSGGPPLLSIEIGVAVLVAAIIFVVALVTLKPEHMAGEPGKVRAGAAVQALLMGLTIGFVLVPLRASLTAAEPDPQALAMFAPAMALVIALRTGALARIPALGAPLRAYRRALLRRQIAGAQKTLAQLEGQA